MSAFYTLLGLRDDGTVPVVDLVEAVSDAQARELAGAWLARHSSCDAAEIWRDRELVGKLRSRPLVRD